MECWNVGKFRKTMQFWCFLWEITRSKMHHLRTFYHYLDMQSTYCTCMHWPLYPCPSGMTDTRYFFFTPGGRGWLPLALSNSLEFLPSLGASRLRQGIVYFPWFTWLNICSINRNCSNKIGCRESGDRIAINASSLYIRRGIWLSIYAVYLNYVFKTWHYRLVLP